MSEGKRYSFDELNKMGIFELRILARNIGVANPTKPRKEILIQRIIEVQNDKTKAVPISKLGRPVKPTALQSMINIGDQNVAFSYSDAGIDAPLLEFEDISTQHDFDIVPQIFDKSKLCIWDEKESISNQIVDILAPIEVGGRVAISGATRTGKTKLMMSLARAAARLNPEYRVMYVSIDEPKENIVPILNDAGIIKYVCTYAQGARSITKNAEDALLDAKAFAMSGNVVLFIDSLDRLAREIVGFLEAQPIASTFRVVSAIKRFFAGTKKTEDGSLTIIASYDSDAIPRMEALFGEIDRYATTVISLDTTLAEQKIFPAILARTTMTRQDELLLDDLTYQNNVKIRRQMIYMQPDKAILQFYEKD